MYFRYVKQESYCALSLTSWSAQLFFTLTKPKQNPKKKDFVFEWSFDLSKQKKFVLPKQKVIVQVSLPATKRRPRRAIALRFAICSACSLSWSSTLQFTVLNTCHVTFYTLKFVLGHACLNFESSVFFSRWHACDGSDETGSKKNTTFVTFVKERLHKFEAKWRNCKRLQWTFYALLAQIVTEWKHMLVCFSSCEQRTTFDAENVRPARL